jgi:hypothetical protein
VFFQNFPSYSLHISEIVILQVPRAV